DTDFRHDEVAAVSLDLVARQLLGFAHRRPRSARHGRHDADRVPRTERGLFPIEMTDVLVVDVNVYEAPQTAVLFIQGAAKVAVSADEPLQRVADRGAFDLHDVL